MYVCNTLWRRPQLNLIIEHSFNKTAQSRLPFQNLMLKWLLQLKNPLNLSVQQHEPFIRGPAFNNRVDDPVPCWHSRDPLAVPADRSKECSTEEVCFEWRFSHVSWSDKQSGSRGCAAPRWGPTFWWRGRLVEGLDKTNGQTIFGKEQSIFQPEVFGGYFQRQKQRDVR